MLRVKKIYTFFITIIFLRVKKKNVMLWILAEGYTVLLLIYSCSNKILGLQPPLLFWLDNLRCTLSSKNCLALKAFMTSILILFKMFLFIVLKITFSIEGKNKKNNFVLPKDVSRV